MIKSYVAPIGAILFAGAPAPAFAQGVYQVALSR